MAGAGASDEGFRKLAVAEAPEEGFRKLLAGGASDGGFRKPARPPDAGEEVVAGLISGLLP